MRLSRGLPSFSIVVETENLANGDLAELRAYLDLLAAQGLDARRPNEVIIVESGQVASPVLDAVRAMYPWLTVHVSPVPLHYYAAKLEGTRLAMGEVVVFADRGCGAGGRNRRPPPQPLAS